MQHRCIRIGQSGANRIAGKTNLPSQLFQVSPISPTVTVIAPPVERLTPLKSLLPMAVMKSSSFHIPYDKEHGPIGFGFILSQHGQLTHAI